MVRLMLVLAPAMCILSAIGISSVLIAYMKNLDAGTKSVDKKLKKSEDNYPKKSEVMWNVGESIIRRGENNSFLRSANI